MRILATLLILAALAATVFLLFRDDGRSAVDARPTLGQPLHESGVRAPNPPPNSRRTEAARQSDRRSEPAPTLHAAAEPAAEVEGPARTVLAVRVVDEEGSTVRRAWIRAAVVGGDPGPTRRTSGAPALDHNRPAPEEGWIEIDVPDGAELTITVGPRESLYFEVTETIVPPLAVGERREVAVEIRIPRGTLYGRVVAAEDDGPLVAATLHLGTDEIGRAFGGRSQADVELGALLATTDSDGRFQFDLVGTTGNLAIVEADGRARGVFRVPADDFDPSRPLRLRLARAATIEGRVLGLDTAGSAWIEASCPGYFFNLLDDFLSIGDGTWRAPIASDGTFRLDRLLPETPLSVQIGTGRRAQHQIAGEQLLEAGELRRVEWSVGGGAVLRVLAVDTSGRPAADVQLDLFAGADAGSRMRAENYWDSVQRARTDAGGVAEFADVGTGEWAVAPRPIARYTYAEPDLEAAAPEVSLVSIGPDDDFVELRIEVHRGLWITGRVVQTDGAPVRAGSVSGSHAEVGSSWTSAPLASDGRFALGPLTPGAWNLSSNPREPGGLRGTRLRNVEAGTADLELVALEGGRVVVALRDGGDLVAAKVVLATDGSQMARMSTIAAGGIATFDGLEPGTYHLAAVAQDGRVGTLRDVQVSVPSSSDPFEIPLGPGGEIRVRYDGPNEYAQVRVLADGIPVALDGLRSGTSTVMRAPLGPAVVRFSRYPTVADASGDRSPTVDEVPVNVTADTVADAHLVVDGE